MGAFLQDLRYAARMMAKQPAFTAIAALTLALGIGANTAIFSVVNAVLLRPLPYPHSEQLVMLRERLLGPSGFESGSVSYLNYLDWRAAQHSFTDLALVRRESVNVAAAGSSLPAERIAAARITANYFSVLGVPPELGRDLLETDDLPGAAKVVLISERLWHSRFGGLPLALGQQLKIDSVPREIIGVVPARVGLPRNADVFIPLADLRADHDFLSRGNHESFSCVGRLKPNVTLEQARPELETIAANLAKRFPDSNVGRKISAKLLLEYSVGEYRYLLYLLLGAVGCVLLIACANVANLQLGARNCAPQRIGRARGTGREPLATGAAPHRRKRIARAARRMRRFVDRMVESRSHPRNLTGKRFEISANRHRFVGSCRDHGSHDCCRSSSWRLAGPACVRHSIDGNRSARKRRARQRRKLATTCQVAPGCYSGCSSGCASRRGRSHLEKSLAGRRSPAWFQPAKCSHDDNLAAEISLRFTGQDRSVLRSTYRPNQSLTWGRFRGALQQCAIRCQRMG